jgi:hypothetical protein
MTLGVLREEAQVIFFQDGKNPSPILMCSFTFPENEENILLFIVDVPIGMRIDRRRVSA